MKPGEKSGLRVKQLGVFFGRKADFFALKPAYFFRAPEDSVVSPQLKKVGSNQGCVH